MDLRAILFDINGTLIDIETDERMDEAYRTIGHFLVYQGICLRRCEVRDLYFQVMKEQFAESAEKYPEFDVVKVWRECLRRTASNVTRSLPAEKLEQLPLLIAEVQRGVSRRRLKCFPGALEILQCLKQHYQLAVVSDAQTAYAVPELQAVGLREFFDPIIVSGDFGYRKPDSRLFLQALERLRVTSSQAIFVGNDTYRDVFGAQQLGMRTILFSPNGTWPEPNEAKPDYVMYNFADLPRALDFLIANHL
ncbi:MAG: HAD family hydrolase [Bryobacteraceae bacterium]